MADDVSTAAPQQTVFSAAPPDACWIPFEGANTISGSDLASRLREAVNGRLDAYLEDLRSLTSIDCPTRYKPGLNEAASIIDRRLTDLGAKVEVVSHETAGNDVIGRIEGTGQSRILFLCHTDTVYPVGTVESRPFHVQDGRILAPGVCDMKAGLLASLYCLLALRDAGYEGFGSITVLCNSDEESAPRHSVGMIQDEARRADCVLTMEPARANGDIVSARKGVAVYQLTATGREAHAGVNPDVGRNAIVALADRIVAAWGLNGRYPGLNVSPGLIQGGSSVNTVAGSARCGIDVRVASAADLDKFDGDIRTLLSDSIIPDVRFELVRDHTMPPMEKTDASTRLVTLAKTAAEELGFTVNDTATGGGSDGAYAAETGTPVLDGLGPIGGGAHSPGEYVELESIVPRVAMLARLVTLVEGIS